MVKRLTAIPLPDDSYFAAWKPLARLEGIEKVLVDPRPRVCVWSRRPRKWWCANPTGYVFQHMA